MTTNRLSDADLVSLCRDGDEQAWALLVQRFSPYVYAVCARGYGLHGSQAEEVFQDVFARVYEHLDGLRSAAALRPWIGQLTRRRCLDAHRAARWAAGPPEDHLEDLALRARLDVIDEALTVRVALEALPPGARDVLERFFCDDQSYRQISAELGVPAGTIASRISRALARLRDELAEEQVVAA